MVRPMLLNSLDDVPANVSGVEEQLAKLFGDTVIGPKAASLATRPLTFEGLVSRLIRNLR
jgi:hypothetical protein